MNTKKTVDDIYAMCDSRYGLVNLIAQKARNLSEEAEKRHEPLLEKPVNIVLANLLSGKSTIAKASAPVGIYKDEDFEVSVSVESEEF